MADVPVVGVPLSTPVLLFMLSHAGSPLALQFRGVALVPLVVSVCE